MAELTGGEHDLFEPGPARANPRPAQVREQIHWIDVTNGQAVLDFSGHSGYRWSPCGSMGTAGECAFLSAGGNYTFGANSSPAQYGQQVNYTLTYSR